MVTPRIQLRIIRTKMAAAASETNVSRYPSEKSVKEALDMLKPPGILSKVRCPKLNISSKRYLFVIN